jgi:hypothetical protein
MSLLIGVLACHHRSPHLTVCRETWIPDVTGCEYRFFYGRGSHEEVLPDEVVLDCDDAYRGLACKVQSSVRWALDNGYTEFFKIDDDTYCRPERIVSASEGWSNYDFVGRMLGPTDKYHEHAYARGGTGYYLSNRAMEALASAPTPNPDIASEYAEDSWVGKILAANNIEGHNDDRLRCADMSGPNRSPRPRGFQGWKKDCPTVHNNYITVCEFLGGEMRQPHNEWTYSQDARSSIMSRLKLK